MQIGIRILTCNVRCVAPRDGEDNWPHRKALCIDIVRSQNADVLCFQELTQPQDDDVTEGLSGYGSYGLPDEPLGNNCLNRIFYRKDRLIPIASGGYWLSETPHVAGSRSWDSAYIRLANWIRLQDTASGREFRVINTHLDCDSQAAREAQAQCIVQDAQAYPTEYPQILTGDMNCDAANAAIEAFKTGGWYDTYGSVHGTEDPGHTYHAFRGPAFKARIGKMDWIFVRGNVKPLHADIITDSLKGRFPSDHYFVSAELSIGEQSPAQRG